MRVLSGFFHRSATNLFTFDNEPIRECGCSRPDFTPFADDSPIFVQINKPRFFYPLFVIPPPSSHIRCSSIKKKKIELCIWETHLQTSARFQKFPHDSKSINKKQFQTISLYLRCVLCKFIFNITLEIKKMIRLKLHDS